MTGVSYATSAEMASAARRLPRLQEEPRAHAARDAQPPPRRLRREDRLREGVAAAGAARPPRAGRQRRLPGPRRPRQARLGHRAQARRGARLPQRAGHRDRADRHDRPGDGLRHHRHRARLRDGEVQEARRRRLLQDHQPRGARGAARARLLRERHRRDRGLCGRPRHARAGARDQPHHAEGQGLHRRDDRQDREGAAHRLRHQVRLQQVDAGRGLPEEHARRSGRDAGASRASTCSRTWASPSARSRRPTSTSAAR